MARNAAAQTAFGPMVLAAIEQHESPARRLVDDDLAGSFLPRGLRALIAATRWSPVRSAMMAASDRSAPYRRFRERTQVWKYGLRPDEVEQFLEGYGWRLLDQLGPDETRDRYVQPTGRNLPTSGLEWSALARKI
ncbi:hypothetical protein A5642_23280 [Mycolicibacterium mucogenicum]|uniref:SAM-dependent methyltransferase n=1 Tax=Mycolicibacterium mucogenicum TaxID=56689 RepID=A0A1A0MKY7_MYCMU|nr:hypothetical protein [Mycolicibacterium mucogenicum]OBA86072.1 hypothetical protein A5642_23280 [Mycolicibacterium mucogenicum]